MEQKNVTTPPLEVRPLLKLARWTLLVSGIIYGIVQKRKYTVIENKLREEEERERPAREARMRCERLRRNAADMAELERIFLGTTSTDTTEIPCNGDVTSEDKSSVSDSTKEIVVPSDDNQEIPNMDELEETDISPGYDAEDFDE
ncbi:uncharacterized protein LOC143265361 [Megachile rotundata]|uniref:uncharacterized protein LOC143265361 n=1 Tax=Megachile rotundata TaxID=143995 RepID=UPI003FD360AA